MALTQRQPDLLPFMNFSCNGTITKLVFIGRFDPNDQSLTTATSWPYFSLWHRRSRPLDNMYSEEEEYGIIGPSDPNQFTVTLKRNGMALIEVHPCTHAMFEDGDILGVRLMQSPGNPRHNIEILKQAGGYGQIMNCHRDGYLPIQCSTTMQAIPYIAIGASEPLIY